MPTLPKEEAGILKAQIFDLSEEGAKQALYGMVKILEEHPSILLVPFRLLIEDAAEYSKVKRKGALVPGVWGG